MTRWDSPGEDSCQCCPCSPRWIQPASVQICSWWAGCSQRGSCTNGCPCLCSVRYLFKLEVNQMIVHGPTLEISAPPPLMWEAYKGQWRRRWPGEDAWAGSFNIQQVCHYVVRPERDWNRDRERDGCMRERRQKKRYRCIQMHGSSIKDFPQKNLSPQLS